MYLQVQQQQQQNVKFSIKSLVGHNSFNTNSSISVWFVDEILWCYHSNETSSAVLSHSTIYLVCISNFESVGEIL